MIINIWNITPSYQTYIPTLLLKCEPKSGLSCRRQMVHPRPQTPQGESVAKPETPLLIILSIAWVWGPLHLVQSVIRKTKSVDKTHPRDVVLIRMDICKLLRAKQVDWPACEKCMSRCSWHMLLIKHSALLSQFHIFYYRHRCCDNIAPMWYAAL